MLAAGDIKYSPMGKPIGLDMGIVIDLVKMKNDPDPVRTIEKVMHLSRELIRDGN